MKLRSHCPKKEDTPIKSAVMKRQLRSAIPARGYGTLPRELVQQTAKMPKKNERECPKGKKARNVKCESKNAVFKTPEPRRSLFTPASRKSTLDAWNRAFKKTSPSTEVLVSPVKASQANLENVLFKRADAYVDVFVWIVNMSEQFFYDNSLILLNGVKSDHSLIKNRLRHNYREFDVAFFRNLQEVTLLGGGSFGKVYSAVDRTTSKKYAVKYLDAKFSDRVQHCENVLDYMAERNSLIRAMNSPFVMDFYYSLQIKSVGGLFLFFEFCIGDLLTYITHIAHPDFFMISRNLHDNKSSIIQDIDKDVDVLDVTLMYIFEMFCGLDFLAQVNIIHQDIKPENLMVSETLHLKIGDFGLIYRTRTIHRETNKLLVKHNEIDASESSNYELDIVGSNYYKDLEIKLMELEDQKSPFFQEVMDNSGRFNAPRFYYDDKVLKSTFLVDTWAAGIVCINLLFRGFDIFDPAKTDPKILLGIPRGDSSVFLIHLVARQIMYKKYVYNGLVNAGGDSLKELMVFIASIFQPRGARVKQFVKTKTIYQYTKKSKVKYIDMQKLENIKPFRDRKFSCKSIFTLAVPEKIRSFYTDPKAVSFPTFEHLLEETKKLSKGERLLELKPGLPINYFRKFL